MAKLLLNKSKKAYLQRMQENSDSWFRYLSESYQFLRIGSYFYLAYHPDYRLDRRNLEAPQVFGKVIEIEEGKIEVRYTPYYGISLRDLVIYFVASMLFYWYFISSVPEGSNYLGIFVLLCLSLLIPFALYTWYYTKNTESGRKSIKALMNYLQTGGNRH